jgi:chromate transport protein ChrA
MHLATNDANVISTPIPNDTVTTMTTTAPSDAHSSGVPAAERPTLWQIFFEFLLIGAVSFGGGIVAYERMLLIEKRQWLSADSIMATLALNQTMSGLNPVNLTLLAGDQLRGTMDALLMYFFGIH